MAKPTTRARTAIRTRQHGTSGSARFSDSSVAGRAARASTVPPMRYLVTGAAGFIGSHLSDALRRRGARCRRARLLHRLLRRRAEGGERARPEILRLDLARDPIDLARLRRGVPPRRAAGRAQLRRRLRDLPRAQRARLAAPLRGGGARRRPRRLRVVVVGLRRRRGVPDGGDTSAAAGLAVRDHEARLRAPGPRDRARASASTSSWLRYFNAYGPRQRPDMAFTRIAMCLAEGRPFDLFGDGLQSRSFTYVADVVDGDDRGDGAPASGTYNVGGGAEATMRDDDRDVRGVRRPPARDPRPPGGAGRPAADEGRHDADPERARLGADDVAARRSAAQWEWAAARVAAR